MTFPRSRQLVTVVGLLALVVASAACSSADAKGAAPKTTASKTTPTTVHKENPDYDAGSIVTITPTGFEPKQLVATVGVPLRFVNRTTTVQHVQFEHSRGPDGQLRASGAIAPGRSWGYTPTSWESATYHSTDRPAWRGQIQIQPPAEP